MKQITFGGFSVITNNANEDWETLKNVLKDIMEYNKELWKDDEDILEPIDKKNKEKGKC